tara:strand:- start:236 stop:988 length:753 start_codon:yes stop_codon:yes gene_type:complete
MKYLLIALFFISYLANGQVGIGTDTPNASAKLDVSATNKGFLPPRISLTSVTDSSTISSPAIGLLVYCKGDAGLAAGYYFWNGSSWATIAQSGTTNYGDVKTGFQAADHNGWIKLDGRAISNLSATQQAQARAFGFTTNLPNASNSYLSQNGNVLGSVSGSNVKTIARNQLPNVQVTGKISIARSGQSWTDNSTGVLSLKDIITSTNRLNNGDNVGTGGAEISFDWNLNNDVVQQSMDVTPKSFSVNTFI